MCSPRGPAQQEAPSPPRFVLLVQGPEVRRWGVRHPLSHSHTESQSHCHTQAEVHTHTHTPKWGSQGAERG